MENKAHIMFARMNVYKVLHVNTNSLLLLLLLPSILILFS